MRVIPAGLARTAVALVLGGVGACASAMPASAPYYEEVVPGLKQLPDAEKVRAIDSLQAETLADAAGPRVSVRANFYNESGSRRVEAWVRADDDAYLLVGHIDAGGRVQVVFPNSPADDGFVQGGHTYRVPPFFAGFADEYRWRRSSDFARLSTYNRTRDSYDAGTGYVFAIASWRPMHFDRVADGSRWSSYEISDDEYLSDPRTAVDELAAALAGDDHSAYSVSYARYSSTNNGMYSANYYDRCSYAAADNGLLGYQYGLFGYRGLVSTAGLGMGANWTYFNAGTPLYTPIYRYRAFYDAATGCTYYEPFLSPIIYYTPAPYPVQPTYPLPKPKRPLTPPDKPNPPKGLDSPKLEPPGSTNQRTRPRIIASEEQATDVHGSQTDYRHRGLIVDDPVSSQPARPRGTASRPSIEQMMGRRQPGEVVGRPGTTESMTSGSAQRPRFETPRAPQPRLQAPAASQPHFDAPRAAPAPHVQAPPHVEQVRSAPPPPPPSSRSGSSGGHKTP